MKQWQTSVFNLITDTSTNLPVDVRQAILRAEQQEDAETRAALALLTINHNIRQAEKNVSPICQDTGMITFEIFVPVAFDQLQLTEIIKAAVIEATEQGTLRPNSVDSLTGVNSGDNLGQGTPVIHFHQWKKDFVEMRLLLKGGGCENKNIQYSLPCELEGLGHVGRDFDGIRKCILHSVYQAQGHGCSAGFIGVGIGGDRTTGYQLAKQQLFRKVTDNNPHPDLAKLEDYIMDKANTLGIGTMGFGGNTTILGCKIGAINRIPASFFVSVAYNCWAYRRQGVTLDAKTGKIKKWLYKDKISIKEADKKESNPTKMKTLTLTPPVSKAQIRKLKVGDIVVINGLIHTGRDALHKHLIENDSPVDLRNGILYHCGPVMLKNKEDKWDIKAAGPTTSIREEPYQAEIIKKFGLRIVIGKGGMGQRTLKALKEQGAVYLNAIGGAAQYYAECVKDVEGVDFLNFGVPEAMWHLRVKDFAAIVTMDAHGNSLHEDVEKSALEKLSLLQDRVY